MTRCRFTAEAITRLGPAYPKRLGTVVGESYSKEGWLVLWDGRKTSESIFKGLLEIVPDDTPSDRRRYGRHKGNYLAAIL